MFKVNNINIKHHIISANLNKYTRRRSGYFIVNLELISHLVLVFLLLTLNE